MLGISPPLEENPGPEENPLLSSQKAHSAGEYVRHVQQALDIFYEEVGRSRACSWVPFPASNLLPVLSLGLLPGCIQARCVL